MDNVPTYAYFPPVYYDQGRARKGMKSEGFADFYKTHLSIRGQPSKDPLIPETGGVSANRPRAGSRLLQQYWILLLR
jgi:hypothetical protein